MTMHFIRTSLGVGVMRPGEGVLPIVQVLGIGRNYADHAKEMGGVAPEAPMVFTKNVASACMDGEDIVVPRICQDREQVDFEGELAIVIGQQARDVSEGEALSRVLGFSVSNDVSARWWQKSGSGGQFFRGKSFDSFCPIGPRVAPVSEIGDGSGLRLVTKVNGTTMQDGSTSDMIHSCAKLVSELSRGMTLLPGTVILTGTPSGVGTARNPPVYLKHGDLVEISIDRIGTLRNRVVFEGA
jgi:2-keto-4-pentenoate hydratase/2-oxohepta-3-ene-1,7-dioic acid hydratase in catechol pathway